MKIVEKVAYLKGLADGLKLSAESKKGKIIKGILDVLEEMAESLELLEDENETLEDYITEVDEDLGSLEEDFEKTCGQKPPAGQLGDDNCKCCCYRDKLNQNDDAGEDEIIDDDYENDFIDAQDDENEIKNENDENEIFDGILEWRCPHCKKHVFIKTEEIMKSDDMIVDCPECGAAIKLIEDDGHDCENCAAHQPPVPAEPEPLAQPEQPDYKNYNIGDLGNLNNLRENLKNNLKDIEDRLKNMQIYNRN